MPERQTAGCALADLLVREGVEHVFGLIGSSTMELYDALYDRTEIRYVGTRDERAATGAADGYARAGRRLGVVLAGQSGPGVTNLVTGLAAAKAARSPVLSLGGAVSTSQWQLDAFQEIDQRTMLLPVTKQVFTVLRGDRVVDTVEQAIRVALSPPMGPVHVDLPRDVLMEEIDATVDGPPRTGGAFLRACDIAALPQLVELIGQARRLAIVVGGGVKWAGAAEDVEALARFLGAPMLTSAGHRDAVDNSHPMFVGQMGPRGSSLATDVLREADLVIGIGTRFGFNSTFFSDDYLSPDARLVQVDVDPTALGRYHLTELAIHGDAAAFARELRRELAAADEPAALASEPDWVAAVRERIDTYRAERAQPVYCEGSALTPDVFFGVLRERLPREPIITLDAGTWCLMASESLDFARGPSLLTPLDFASLGFGLPAAIGAQLAQPQRRAIALLGDGGVMFAVGELSTIAAEDIPITLIVMNNSAWGAEKAYQHDFYDQRYIGTDLPTENFAMLARSFGIEAHEARSADELAACLDKLAGERRPVVIDVSVDRQTLHSFRKDAFQVRSDDGGALGEDE